MIKRSATLAILILIISTFALTTRPAVDHAESQREVVKALDDGDYVAAETKLREIRSDSPSDFAKNNLDYSLARVLQKNSKGNDAVPLLDAVIARNSNLSAYALYHLAEISRANHQLTAERNYLDKLLKAAPQSAPARQAQRRLGENYLEGKDYVFGIALLRPMAGTGSSTGRELLVEIGQAYINAGDLVNARAIFTQLVGAPKDDSVLAAAQALDELDKKSNRVLTEYDQAARAGIYMFNRRFPEAREHYMALVEQFPNAKGKPDALYQIGRTYYLENNYDEAVKWYTRVHDEFPDTDQGELGYYHIGHTYQKAGRFLDAVRQYDQFLKAYPKSQWTGGAHLNAIDSLRSAGRLPEALVWVKRAVSNPLLARDLASTTAVFEEAKIQLTQNEYPAALETFTRLQSMNLSQQGPGSTNREEVAFMRGYCLEQMGRISEAAAIYLSLPDERDNFYGHRATLRIQALANSEAGASLKRRASQAASEAESAIRSDSATIAKEKADLALRLSDDENIRKRMLEVLRRAYDQLPAYRAPFGYRVANVSREYGQPTTGQSHDALARELLFLGMYDEGAAELGMANGSYSENQVPSESNDKAAIVQTSYEPNSNDLTSNDLDQRRTRRVSSSDQNESPTGLSSYSLAVYYNRGDRADRAITLGESLFKTLPRDYKLELLPRDFAALNYPAPNKADLLRSAGERGVDPRLVLSLARQESRFKAQAKSTSAARGMMQFITDTSNKIATELNLTDFKQDQLYDPNTAFLFGSQYVKDLLTLFPGNPYAVAASYNGGEDNVARWRERSKSEDVDRLVIELGYQQTKDYVYKVMSNYWAYQAIYSSDLK
ncbi:MAG TPA: tetratricopeptide repeat protein [Blastocatellia bacterium]|nr:tetratricopeptide repeat protein [Blastocatellia bacterium]